MECFSLRLLQASSLTLNAWRLQDVTPAERLLLEQASKSRQASDCRLASHACSRLCGSEQRWSREVGLQYWWAEELSQESQPSGSWPGKSRIGCQNLGLEIFVPGKSPLAPMQ